MPGTQGAKGHFMKARQSAGFTLIELVFVVGTLMLCALVLPALFRPKVRCCAISCSSNLRQIGLAFRMWANDHGDRFPMELTPAEEGTKGLPLQDLPVAAFTTISNEINNPKPFICPKDAKRMRTNNFEQLTAKNLSYFLALDATQGNPTSILAGDRNLRIKEQPTTGLVQITNLSAASWGTDIHNRQGNIGLADGSAHQGTDQLLQKALQATSIATNRFAIP